MRGLVGGARAALSLVALASVELAPARLRPQQVTYTGSVQVASGDYTFAHRTTSLYVANGLTLAAGRWRAAVSVPVIAQDAGWVQYVGSGLFPSGGMHQSDERSPRESPRDGMGGGMTSPQSEADHAEVGLGDPIGRVELDVLRDGAGIPIVRLTGAVKAPVASVARGLGTGAWESGAGVSFARSFSGTFLFADATYWALSDAPSIALHDIVSYGAGVGRPLPGGRLALLGSVLGTTRIVAGVPGPLQAGGGLSYRTAAGRVVSLSLLRGFTRSAPDLSVGFGWQVPLRR